MRVAVTRVYDPAGGNTPRAVRLEISGAGGDRKQPVQQLNLYLELKLDAAERLHRQLGALLPRHR